MNIWYISLLRTVQLSISNLYKKNFISYKFNFAIFSKQFQSPFKDLSELREFTLTDMQCFLCLYMAIDENLLYLKMTFLFHYILYCFGTQWYNIWDLLSTWQCECLCFCHCMLNTWNKIVIYLLYHQYLL